MDLLELSLQTDRHPHIPGWRYTGVVHRLHRVLSNHVTLHVTRCAAEDVEFVVAALLHDIGELLVPISHSASTLLLLPMPSVLFLWCKFK